jgi:hypothetical protein
MSSELEKKKKKLNSLSAFSSVGSTKKVTNTTVSKVVINNLAIFPSKISSACGGPSQQSLSIKSQRPNS